MNVQPFPQGEPDPTVASVWRELLRKPYATFSCIACGHIFAGDVPAIFEDLPRCPLCDAATWIYHILETWMQH